MGQRCEKCEKRRSHAAITWARMCTICMYIKRSLRKRQRYRWDCWIFMLNYVTNILWCNAHVTEQIVELWKDAFQCIRHRSLSVSWYWRRFVHYDTNCILVRHCNRLDGSCYHAINVRLMKMINSQQRIQWYKWCKNGRAFALCGTIDTSLGIEGNEASRPCEFVAFVMSMFS